MSAAAEPVATGDAPGKGRKKLVTLIAVLAVALAGAAGGAAWVAKKRQAAAEAAAAEADEAEAEGSGHREAHAKTPPAFLPMENFIVNLADRDSERYAQIGITLELDDAKYTDQLKAYMPAIRNGVLMVIAHKTSQELLSRAGKEKLAADVMRESVRPLGLELEDETTPARPGNGRTGLAKSPVRHVHFSSFIIQ